MKLDLRPYRLVLLCTFFLVGAHGGFAQFNLDKQKKNTQEHSKEMQNSGGTRNKNVNSREKKTSQEMEKASRQQTSPEKQEDKGRTTAVRGVTREQIFRKSINKSKELDKAMDTQSGPEPNKNLKGRTLHLTG